MAAESSTFAVSSPTKIVQCRPSFLLDMEVNSQLSPQNTISPLSKTNSSLNEQQYRRKRRRTFEQPSFQQLVAPNQINLGLSEKNPLPRREGYFVSWPQNFTFQSNGVNKPVQQSESKHSHYVKNHRQFPRKSPSGIRNNLNRAGLFASHGNNVGNQREEVEKSVDFSKEIEDAISRIESLIPSLQKLAKTVHSPGQKSVSNLGLPNITNSVNITGKGKERVSSTNELQITDKSAAYGESMRSRKASQVLTKYNLAAPLWVKWSRNIEYADDNNDDMRQQMLYLKGDVVPMKDDFKCSNLNMSQRMVDKPSHWVSTPNDGRMKNLELEKNLNARRISQVPGPKFKAVKPESPKGTLSRNGSFASHTSEHIQGLGFMPCRSYRGEATEREATSGPCTQFPSVGSVNSMRHTRTRNMHTSHQKWSESDTSGRIATEKGQSLKMIKPRDSLNRNTLIRKNLKGPLHSKVIPHDQISEETSWSSRTSSSATTQQSGSQSFSSAPYESSGTDSYDSDESEPEAEKVGHSTRRQPEVTDGTASGYDDTSSYYNSQNEYSDAGPSSQMSSARCHKWDLQKEQRKRRGRWRRLGRKLGMIFHHHHHHHHHHYTDSDEPDARHARSFWKRLGKMFHHTRNSGHHQKLKADKPRNSDIKALVKRKQQGGHFHGLVGGLMKHMKHSKKPQLPKNGIKGLGNGRHGGKRKGKKLPLWPKIHGGRGGMKVSNKGKVRLGNFRTKSFAAAKMILKK